ncbi:tape measure protein [Rhizobium favelukesii]|uniref:DNA double-strand break repair rad50 ATPase n=1 Tax=Rhizobium favelukesii TaxID=348824 RepID=W6R7D1_9HYPH|nr:tape measure protein [Rhizobium favelukesii]MCS0460856.1 tape measure protein [Rhizobium favelukesii]CDM57197.1 DNA double-strand break repair rad50 ATPase [Rhizobium favelukesii]
MAATDLERLVVQLSADVTKYERAMNRASNVANKQLASIEKRALSMNRNLGNSFTTLGVRVGAALAGAFTIKGFSELQDSYIKIQNSLKASGLAGQELTGVYNQLYASAQKNAAPIDALATLYSRVAINQKELGVSSEQVAELAETVAKALKAQGSSATEAQGALLQLSQALGSGKVQAEEWGSLIDGAPVLLRAAAAGIKQAGGSVAQLTKLVKSGQLSSKALFDGIQAGAPVIDDMLAGASETAASSMTRLGNSLTNAAGRFGEATGANDIFQGAVSKMVTYLDTVSFDGFIGAINAVATALDGAATKFSSFIQRANEATGLTPKVIEDLNKFGPSTDKQIFDDLYNGGIERAKEKKAAEERLDIERNIAALKSNPVGNSELLRDLQEKRDAILSAKQEAAASGPGSVRKPVQGPLNFQGPAKPAAAVVSPVDITKPEYAVTATGTGKSKKTRTDDYERETQQLREHTAALNAETDAQAKLNPVIDDYGFAVAKARAQQDLLNAAQQTGKVVTPELSAEIDKLSTAYAAAEVAANQLAESQDKIRERAAEIQDLNKEVFRGIVDGFTEGKDAAEVFSEALSKVGSKILDLAFDDFFGTGGKAGAGGGGANILGSFFKMLGFAGGGYTGPGGKYQPAGIVHKGEYVVPKNVVDQVGVGNLEKLLGGYADGGIVGSAPTMPSLSSIGRSPAVSINYAPSYDNRGVDSERLARLEQIQEKDRREFSSRAVNAIQKARKGNVKGL